MLKNVAIALLMCAGLAVAQEAQYGVSVPVTLSAGFMDTHRFQEVGGPNAASAAASFRAMLYPTVRLGSHWFLYAALQFRKVPYFYYDAFFTDRSVTFDPIQAYVGYSLHAGEASVVFKAGQLNTAFGSFPLRYDDVENPLLDQPLGYITEVPLRPDQLSCGTSDLMRQFYGSVAASCGGEKGRGPGCSR